MSAGDARPAAMDFDVGDVEPARGAQVVAGFYYDRRVFLVVNTGAARPVVIGLTPYQAEAIGHDLVDGVTAGAVYSDERERRVEPVVAPVAVQLKPRSSSASRAVVGPAVRIIRQDEPPATT